MTRVIAALFLFFSLSTASSAQTNPDAAAEFIATLGEKAVEILRDQSISLEDREIKLRAIVGDSFDVQTIGRFVLNDGWDKASAEEREEYLELFADYVLQVYTQRLGGYSGQQLEIESSKTHKDRDAVVATRIIQEGSDPMSIQWLVRQSDKGMRILDVIIDGKSLALAQRTEFAAILAREQVSGLLNLLRLKVSKYSAQS